MNRNEQKLFLRFCEVLHTGDGSAPEFVRRNATGAVLGQLFMNRMAGVAYGNLRDSGHLSLVNREFRNSLRAAYQQNAEKNRSYLACISRTTELLRSVNVPYAMLKGALLCALYPEGYRTANDIDLLVRPMDVTTIGQCLLAGGFRQGDIREDRFVPATRKQIIESRMMRGETVPYILEVDLPQMKYLEVDVNFSLDYKNGDDAILAGMLQRATDVTVGQTRVHTLVLTDFFLHLCLHLYKEATTYPWIAMGRDMTLYKFADISLVAGFLIASDVDRLFDKAREYGLERELVYAVLLSDALLPVTNRDLVRRAKGTARGIPDVMREVWDPASGKRLLYPDARLVKRFFAGDRSALLCEAPQIPHTEPFHTGKSEEKNRK